MDCVAGLGACVSLRCKHEVCLSDMFLASPCFFFLPRDLRFTPSAVAGRETSRAETRTPELPVKNRAYVCHSAPLLPLRHVKRSAASGVHNTSQNLKFMG